MKPSILAKLEILSERYDEIGHLLSDAETIANQEKFRSLSKEYSEIESVALEFRKYQKTLADIDEAALLAEDADPDMRAMGREELDRSRQLQAQQERELELLLIPQDPNDSHNIFLEIRVNRGR